MAEAAKTLVEWDQPVDRGSLDTLWVCPTAGLDAIMQMIEAGLEITDENLITHAGGRWRHLTWSTFGDGEIGAAQVVDSETGQLLTAESDSVRFGFNMFEEPKLMSIGNVPLGDGRTLSQVKGTQSIIVSPNNPHSTGMAQAPSAWMDIDPAKRKLQAVSKGEVGLPPEIDAKASAKLVLDEEKDKTTTAELALGLTDADNEGSLGQVNFRLDGQGRLSQVWAYGETAFEILGIDVPLGPPNMPTRATMVTDTEEQRAIFQTTMERLGHEDAERLDLRLTAAGLWNVMDRRRHDPSRILAFR